MTEFTIHTVEAAPTASRPVLEGLQREVGFLPNLAATMAESPTLVEGFTTLRAIVRRGSLTGPEREAIAIALSVENRCTYCVAAHSTFALSQGASATAVAALRKGELPSDDLRLAALARFTRALVAKRGFADRDDLARLLGAGFTRAQGLEAIAMMGMVLLASYTHNLTRIPLDEAFRPQAWSADPVHSGA